jgi:uncharacterized protein
VEAMGTAMTQQPVISVRGEAHMEAEPEVATFEVTVRARDPDRRSVLDRLATRNTQVLALINGYGKAVEKLESGATSVSPDIKYEERAERVKGYLGQASARVVIRDFVALGELMAVLADDELVTVAGPWWSLRPDSPVYHQARIAAAQDATRRAREYAQAFGGELGGLIEAADTGLLTWNPQRGIPFQAMAADGAAHASPTEPTGMALGPVKQTVTAQIEARFAMLLPELRHR